MKNSGCRTHQVYRVRHSRGSRCRARSAGSPAGGAEVSPSNPSPNESGGHGGCRLRFLAQPARARPRRATAHPDLHLGRRALRRGRGPFPGEIRRARHPATDRLHAARFLLAGQARFGCAGLNRDFSVASRAGSRPRNGSSSRFLRSAPAATPWPAGPVSTISRAGIGTTNCSNFAA